METTSLKNFTKVLVGITAVFLVFGAYIIFGPKLAVVDVRQSVSGANERPEAFAQVAAGVGRGDFGSNQYGQLESNRPENHSFTTITVTVRNRSILKAEWAQIGISPLAEDIVLVTGEPVDIPPLGSAELTASVLSKAGEERERALWVDYYLFGYKETAQ